MSFLVLGHFTWHHVIGAIDCFYRKKEKRLLCKVLKQFQLSCNNEGKYSNSTRNRINKLFSNSRKRSSPAAFEKLQIVRQSTGKYPPECPWQQFYCRALLKVYKYLSIERIIFLWQNPLEATTKNYFLTWDNYVNAFCCFIQLNKSTWHPWLIGRHRMTRLRKHFINMFDFNKSIWFQFSIFKAL